MKGLDKIFIGCKQATYLHEQKRAGKISVPERAGLAIHLLYCRFCKLFVKQVERLDFYTKQFGETGAKKILLNPLRKAELQKKFNDALK